MRIYSLHILLNIIQNTKFLLCLSTVIVMVVALDIGTITVPTHILVFVEKNSTYIGIR